MYRVCTAYPYVSEMCSDGTEVSQVDRRFMCQCEYDLRNCDESRQDSGLVDFTAGGPIPWMGWCIFTKDDDVALADAESLLCQGVVDFLWDL